MTHVLVTGGAGYIGSHACKALSEAGYIPVTFDNLRTGWKQAVKFGPFVQGDLLNKFDLRRVFEKFKPAAILHFAALSQVGESIKNPGLYWENNVIGSLNLIQSAVDHGCMNFVFSSTCATYGDHDNVVLDENSAQNPINAYGASKLAVENALSNFGAAFGLKYVIFRYFNVAGADPEAVIGEFHKPETHLVPLILDTAAGKREALTINGVDYPTPDGTCIRDYVHVGDLVDAHALGLDWLLAGNRSRAFNLGTGKGFSVREVIENVENVTGCKISVVVGPKRTGDCTKLVSGSNRASIELGWSAGRSNMRKMVEDAWRWHQVGHYLE